MKEWKHLIVFLNLILNFLKKGLKLPDIRFTFIWIFPKLLILKVAAYISAHKANIHAVDFEYELPLYRVLWYDAEPYHDEGMETTYRI